MIPVKVAAVLSQLATAGNCSMFRTAATMVASMGDVNPT